MRYATKLTYIIMTLFFITAVFTESSQARPRHKQQWNSIQAHVLDFEGHTLEIEYSYFYSNVMTVERNVAGSAGHDIPNSTDDSESDDSDSANSDGSSTDDSNTDTSSGSGPNHGSTQGSGSHAGDGMEEGIHRLQFNDWKLGILLNIVEVKDMHRKGAVIKAILTVKSCELKTQDNLKIRYRRVSTGEEQSKVMRGLEDAKEFELKITLDRMGKVKRVRGLQALRSGMAKKTSTKEPAGIEIMKMANHMFQDDAFAEGLQLALLSTRIDPVQETALAFSCSHLLDFPWASYPMVYEPAQEKARGKVLCNGYLSDIPRKKKETLPRGSSLHGYSKSRLDVNTQALLHHDLLLKYALKFDQGVSKGQATRETRKLSFRVTMTVLD